MSLIFPSCHQANLDIIPELGKHNNYLKIHQISARQAHILPYTSISIYTQYPLIYNTQPNHSNSAHTSPTPATTASSTWA